MTAFATALAAIFADPNLARAATYKPAAGGEIACRVILQEPDEVWEGAGTGLSVHTRIADVRVSEVATAAKGDTLTIDGTDYTVAAPPRKADDDRLMWRLELVPA